jgi:energy-coupling factor transport system substrate-specific component
MIGWALWKTERNLSSQSDTIVLFLLGIFAVSGRILLEPIPNVQPVTVIILMSGIYFGVSRSIILATSVALVSNLFIGHGLWTLYQAIGWSLVGIIGATLSNKLHLNNATSNTSLMAVAASCAFIFDWIVSLSVLHTLGPDLLFVYILSGIPFDILHAVGNMFFVAWLASPLSEIMTRHLSVKKPLAVKELVKNRI